MRAHTRTHLEHLQMLLFHTCNLPPAELFTGAEGDVRDGGEEQRGFVRGGFVSSSIYHGFWLVHDYYQQHVQVIGNS